MQRRNWLVATAVGALLASLFIGFTYLAGLTSSGGYPTLSSFNSNKDGAKLLFDALSRVATLRTSRNFLPFSQWHPSGSAILYLNVNPSEMNWTYLATLKALESLTQPDNRLIIAIRDEEVETWSDKQEKKKPRDLGKRWGIRFKNLKSTDKDDISIYLEHDSTWHELPSAQGVWEKNFGKGSLLIVLPYWDFSNEEIAAGDTAQILLPALLADKTKVTFEETHLGIEQSGSIMGLARRYRLQGFLAGLMLVLSLFLWNRLVSFPPPPREEEKKNSLLEGAEARGMFAGLLTRHLSPAALLKACAAEWNRLYPHRLIDVAETGSHPVEGYRQIQESLQHKRKKT